MKQLAEEVWKKYGEAAVEITADGWKLPPIEILDNAPEIEFSQADNMKKAKLIEDALSSYGVESKVVQINVGHSHAVRYRTRLGQETKGDQREGQEWRCPHKGGGS
jgi:DNA segregation ATPase FtsK/SpoIIIE-like protein